MRFDMTQMRAASAARREAMEVTLVAFQMLASRLAERAGAIYGLQASEVIRVVRDEACAVADELRATLSPQEPASRPASRGVDQDGPRCGDSACTDRHSPFGHHQGRRDL